MSFYYFYLDMSLSKSLCKKQLSVESKSSRIYPVDNLWRQPFELKAIVCWIKLISAFCNVDNLPNRRGKINDVMCGAT